MRNAIERALWAVMLCLAAAGCTTLPPSVSAPALPLTVSLLYPAQGKEVATGANLRVIAQVSDAQGRPVTDGQLDVTVSNTMNGEVIGTFEAAPDDQGTYRGGPWPIPYRIPEGPYRLALTARRGPSAGAAEGTMQVVHSTSDLLLDKYGFWLAAPALRGINPQLVAERGDARDGMIRWGGQIPSQHVLPDNWVEVHWRNGRYNLDGAEAARRFMTAEIGAFGFTPIRSIGPFEPYRFKNWDGWKAGGRGEFRQNQVEWVAFYAPEVDKTYLIGTTVTLPPTGIDPHAALRDSFEVHPEVAASGEAPEPLSRLLPGPELLEPPLGARYLGVGEPIVLKWQPVVELAPDEYYQVAVDYNYQEANETVEYTTRETHLALPESLYDGPNCGVFNWRVTLMREDGAGGESVSYPSLYSYVEWRYPPGAARPFPLACPNAQF